MKMFAKERSYINIQKCTNVAYQVYFRFDKCSNLVNTGGYTQTNFEVSRLPVPIYFHFHAVFGQIISWQPLPSPAWGWCPVKSWICPCLKQNQR